MNKQKAAKHYDEARALQQQGRVADAERAYRKAIKAFPAFPEALTNLGQLLIDRGQYREAAVHLRKANQTLSGHPLIMYNLAHALQLTGDLQKAVTWYRRTAEKNPDFIGTHINLGNTLRSLAQYPEAISAYRKAIELDPGNADIYNNIGGVLLDADHFNELDECIAMFRKAVELNPKLDEAYNGLGNALSRSGDSEAAIEAFRQAVRINPQHQDAWHGLANALSDFGEIDESVEAYRKTVSVSPQHAYVYRSLAKNRKFTEFDDDMAAMTSIHEDSSTSDETRMHLAFGLGKAWEDLKDYDRAINYLLEANRLKRASLDYSSAQTRDTFEAIKACFSADYAEHHRTVGCEDPSPLFVLGMPRSGTSLAEQILASHPDVYGAGELIDIPFLINQAAAGSSNPLYPAFINELSDERLLELGRLYIERLRRYNRESRYITDKSPPNFQHIGFIKTLLPRAKIVYCRRDPMDNCLSLFKNFFASELNYSYDLVELGEYYQLHNDLMAHWKKVYPDGFYELDYETLVADQEPQTRALLDYCELPWNDACLEFHTTRRKVRTASNAQVRQPIYSDSVKLWQRYGDKLSPLADLLVENT